MDHYTKAAKNCQFYPASSVPKESMLSPKIFLLGEDIPYTSDVDKYLDNELEMQKKKEMLNIYDLQEEMAYQAQKIRKLTDKFGHEPYFIPKNKNKKPKLNGNCSSTKNIDGDDEDTEDAENEYEANEPVYHYKGIQQEL